LPRLGVAGGLIHELINGSFVKQRTSLDSVAGAVQLFRKECYDAISGYVPLRFGGVDSAAEITARMHGWDVRTFQDLEVRHHRRVSSGETGLIKTKLRHGRRHYSLGYHPAFEALRCIYRVTDRPWAVGSVLTAIGYIWAWVVQQKRELPAEVIEYVRAEQRNRLHCLLSRRSAGDDPIRERSR
jgi:poly-beta-1,6-N-acetyl-D-glucosamine synthase